ncbi:MAG: DUF2262 domain-containing protein [Planctomycetaceae bacterium]|jgi:hypothetical protein|nr:DUF2262 domain-containing protein [Planctomycetaceae bacterium]
MFFESQQTVSIETERYGTLTLHTHSDCFEGKALWNGRLVEVSFTVSDDVDIASQLKIGDSLFDDSRAWADKVSAYAVLQNLPLANDWQEVGAVPITEEEFLRRLQLTAISIGIDGRFEFYHDDGDLFYGHCIIIGGSLAEGVDDSQLFG